jgi:hypothetical protein
MQTEQNTVHCLICFERKEKIRIQQQAPQNIVAMAQWRYLKAQQQKQKKRERKKCLASVKK